MTNTTTSDPMPKVPLRLPHSLVQRLDRHADRLARRIPGATITRSTAIRVLLSQALARAEAEARS